MDSGLAPKRARPGMTAGVISSMRRLGLQRLVDIIALPAGFLVVDLHVERQRELALRECRVEIGRQHLEDMLAGLFARREVAAFAKPQHHVEKAEMRPAVG